MMKGLIISSHEVVTSTSDLVFEAAKAGAPEGTAITASVQTKGRGRHGRQWFSPEGNFYISVLFRPARPRGDWPSLSLVSGLALYAAVAEWRDPSDLGLKWPNDLLYQGGKTAGILLEAQDDVVVLGCGVNLNAPPDQVEGWAPSALNQSKNLDLVTKEGLLAYFDQHLTRCYNLWSETGFAALKPEWLASSAHHQARLTIDQGQDKVLEGVFSDLTDDGRLCLRDDNGVDHVLSAGDVMRARLA